MHIKVSMEMEVSDIEPIKVWEHHIDRLISDNEYPEIESIWNVEVKEVED